MKELEFIEELNAEAKRIVFDDPNNSYNLSKEAWRLGESIKDELAVAWSKYNGAVACSHMTCYDKGIRLVFEALRNFEKHNTEEGIVGSYNLLGVFYLNYAKYELALKFFLKGLDILEVSSNPDMKQKLFNNVGEIYKETNEYDKAHEYYQKALDANCSEKDNEVAAVITMNIGNLFYLENKYDLAEAYYKEGRRKFSVLGNIKYHADVSNRLGEVYLKRGSIDDARRAFQKSLDILEVHNYDLFKINALVNMGKLVFEYGEQKEDALEYYMKALGVSEILENASRKLEVLYLIYEYYEKQSNYQKALEFYKMYSTLEKDEELHIAAKRLEVAAIEFEWEKTLKENERLKEQTVVNEAKKKELNRINYELSILTHIDPLTGIPNRRSLEQYLGYIISGNDLTKRISVLMVDIDNFKMFNDRNGHLHGDECLKKVAEKLNQVVGQKSGFIARFGGEEFIVILEGDDEYQHVVCANKLRKSIENLDVRNTEGVKLDKVTVSIGVYSAVLNNIKNVNQLISYADQGLYLAKRSGRNCVRVFNDELAVEQEVQIGV